MLIFLLSEGQPVCVDEGGQAGRDVQGDFFEFPVRRLAGHLVTGRGRVRSYGNDRAVPGIGIGRVSEQVEGLFRTRKIVDPDKENYARSDRFAADQ